MTLVSMSAEKRPDKISSSKLDNCILMASPNSVKPTTDANS